jgi:hypothetical protein
VRYVVVVVVWLLIARSAVAHQSSTKYLELDVDRDRARLELRFVPGDVTEPMKLGPNAKPSVEAAAAAPGVPAYVASWILVRTPSGATCTADRATARAAEDGFVAVTWTASCPSELDTIVLDASAFFALDRKMELLVHMPGADASIRVTAIDSPITLVLDPRSPLIAGALGGLALERLAFCLLIALAAALASWRALAIMLGAYSLAYLAGSLSGIALPYGGELVAATLIYAGAETALRPDWRWRTATFAAFGVVHGIAASHQRSILIFNIAATLVATALTFAVFGIASSQLRRAGVRRVIAGAVCVFGIVWLVERLFGT